MSQRDDRDRYDVAEKEVDRCSRKPTPLADCILMRSDCGLIVTKGGKDC